MDLDDEELKATRRMNGSDKSVGSIEEDIKILEDYIELIKKGYCEDCNELCNIYGTPTYPAKKISKAAEHLIKGYKEKEKHLNFYEKNGSYKARIIGLEEENETLKNLANNKQWISPCYVAQNYIPVSLVKEKIEELDKEYRKILCKEGMSADKFDKLNKLEIEIEVLQELLEGE